MRCQRCNHLSILEKRNFHLTRIIRQIYDLLSEYCVSNNFYYLTNDNISEQNLCKDSIQLNNAGNDILVENFISYVNELVLTKLNSF